MRSQSNHPHIRFRAVRFFQFFAVGSLLCGLIMPPDAQAKKHKSHKATASQAGANKGSSKATHRPSSSEESRAERERRLLRECHGMPDAGACRGYTRG